MTPAISRGLGKSSWWLHPRKPGARGDNAPLTSGPFKKETLSWYQKGPPRQVKFEKITRFPRPIRWAIVALEKDQEMARKLSGKVGLAVDLAGKPKIEDLDGGSPVLLTIASS